MKSFEPGPQAAAIGVGIGKLHVSIVRETPKVFWKFSGRLEALQEWLDVQVVRSVAMEATVYIGFIFMKC